MSSRLPNPILAALITVTLGGIIAATQLPLRWRGMASAHTPQRDDDQAPAAADKLPFPESRVAGRVAAPPGSGQAVLERAILTLENHPFLRAKIRQSGDLFDQRPIGSGIYLQRRDQDNLWLRLEVRVQLGEQPSSLVQVCKQHSDADRSEFWVYRKLPYQEATLERIDVDWVISLLEEMGQIEQLERVGQWPGLGGLPKLLRGLHATFDFAFMEETQLAGGFPAWKLRGQWKPDKLRKLLPDQKESMRPGESLDLSKLSPHLPDQVLLFLGKEDLFPYRLEYRRRDPKDRQRQGGPLDRSIVTVELFEVNLIDPVPLSSFEFPVGRDYSDKTDSFIEGLGLEP